ncbi:FadR/GntR family transcriptional regulator [Rhodococcus sp. ACT016]|uniref:FadR/GntR family transcriptional regulator n=1 Tax=Rhodococcus sp. ACT016 TaxID=3134808 RepID=UPI003D2A6D71
MDALTRVPLSQQVAQALLDEIATGRWEVGEQLPGEMDLAGRLGVGRSTIREAIRQLAARGVLTTKQGVGVFLTSATPVEPWDRLAQVGAIAEVLQVRVAIESRAAALAATNHDDSDAGAIRRALADRNRILGGDPAELAAADISFHRRVVAGAHNSLLIALFDSLQQRLVEAMTDFLALVPATPEDADEHAEVVEAVLSHDAERAEDLTRRHLLGLARSLTDI